MESGLEIAMTRAKLGAPEAPPAVPTDVGAGLQDDTTYPIGTAMRRLRVGRHWLRSAKAAGLPIRRQGNRSFLLGREFAEWIAKTGAE
jgi:hypothetical protein